MVKLGVSYFGNRFLEHASRDMAQIAECCDYVVHTVSEADLQYHKFVLSKIFLESQKKGLEVWADPWALGGVFGGEAHSRFLLDHREFWQAMSDGALKPVACLNRTEWRSYVKEWILNVKEMGAQVIFWDEPHIAYDLASELSGIYACACTECQTLFKKKFGVKPPTKRDQNVELFQLETMKSFLEEIFEFAKEKKLKNALCVYAIKGHKRYDALWEKAAGLKNLDIFGCDPYWRWRGQHNPEVHVADFSRRVKEAARPHGKATQIWIQAMRLPKGTEEEIVFASEAAVKERIDYLAAWSFDGGELLDTVLAERPREIWKTVVKAFERIRQRQ